MKRMIVMMVMALATAVGAQQTNILDKVQQAFDIRQQVALSQYGKELGALLEDARKDGDLDKLLILQAEQKRFEAEKKVPPPAEAHVSFFAPSKAHYRAMVSLLKQYVTALDDLIKKQVQAGQIEEAKILKAEKDRASSILAETQTMVSTKEGGVNSPETPQLQQNKKWDVAKEFSNALNPSGVWSYGVITKPGGSFVLFRNNRVQLNEIQLSTWTDGGANVWMNSAEASRYGVGAGQVSIHPGPNGEFGVIRWTCSHLKSGQSDKLTVKGTFGAGDSGKMNVCVLHNGKKLFAATNTPRAEPFSLDVKVQPQDTLDFAVGPGSAGWGCGNTPLNLVITSK